MKPKQFILADAIANAKDGDCICVPPEHRPEPEQPDLTFMRLHFVIPDGWREVFKGKTRLNDRYPSPGRACYYWLTICAERHIGRNVRDFVCVIRKQ